MLTRFRALPLALSALLALSSCLPCYTLAYADEGAEVIADGQQDDRAAGSGDEFEEGSAQPAPYNEAGEGAAPGETEAEDIWEVSSGSSPDSGGPADSGLDGSAEDAYSSGWGYVEPSLSDSLDLSYQGGYFPDLISPADSGIMLLAGFGGGFGSDGPGFGGAFGTGSGRGKIANNTDIADILTSQWGWGYGSGTTAILYKNSPAGWLSGLYSNSSSIYNRIVSPSVIITISENLLKVISGLTSVKDAVVSNSVSQNTVSTISVNLLKVISGLSSVVDAVNANAVSQNTLSTISNNILRVIDGLGLVKDNLISQNTVSTISVNLLAAKNTLDGILSKLDDLHFDANVTVDMSGVESRLDDIKSLLLLAGTKDIIDTILGDLDDMASAALLGEVQAAAQNAFPFCIPFVVKQLLGLVESDPAAPEFDFVIGGETMHVDLAFAQGFVDILGWACRFLLVFGLVVSSRRFIYTGAVS